MIMVSDADWGYLRQFIEAAKGPVVNEIGNVRLNNALKIMSRVEQGRPQPSVTIDPALVDEMRAFIVKVVGGNLTYGGYVTEGKAIVAKLPKPCGGTPQPSVTIDPALVDEMIAHLIKVSKIPVSRPSAEHAEMMAIVAKLPKPIDPDLIKARELCGQIVPDFAEDYSSGKRDSDIRMAACLAGLRSK